jgi:hypothetical protein
VIALSSKLRLVPVLIAVFALPATRAAGQPSVTFDDFPSVATSDFRVTFLGTSPAPDLDGPGGIAAWLEWCYRITALQDTSTSPGEFTHVSFGIPDAPPFNQVESEIENSMVVSDNDADYSAQFRSSASGPLAMRGAEWNNEGDHLVTENEAADFCFSTPAAPVGQIPIGMKVDGDRLFATIAGPGFGPRPAPTLAPSGLAGLALLLFAIRSWAMVRRGRE